MFRHLLNKAISLTSGKDNYTSGTSSFMVGQYLFKRFNKLFTASSEIYHQAKQRQGNEWGGGPTLHISLCDNKRLTVCWTHIFKTGIWSTLTHCRRIYELPSPTAKTLINMSHTTALPYTWVEGKKNILFLITASLTMLKCKPSNKPYRQLQESCIVFS